MSTNDQQAIPMQLRALRDHPARRCRTWAQSFMGKCPLKSLTRPLFILGVSLSWIAHGFAADNRPWQVGKVILAEQPRRSKPEIEVWNPSLTHWYAIETGSEIVKATETVPAGVKRRGTTADVDRDPPMAFQVGEKVKVAIGDPPLDPKAHRELFVIDRKGREHILTVDGITPKREN